MLGLLGACGAIETPVAGVTATPSAGVLQIADAAPAVGEVEPPPDRTCAAEAAHHAGTEVGYLLFDLESGEQLAALNPDLALIPASASKLATALVALDILGADHRYRTALFVRGAVANGTLVGDLVLEGTGDPSLELADLLGLALELRARGIARVDGRFLIDDMAFPWTPEIDPGQPAHAGYNQAVGALAIGAKRVDLARLMNLVPSGRYLAAGEKKADTAAPAASRERGADAFLAAKDPGLHAGEVFRWLAAATGVVLAAPERGPAPTSAEPIATHRSLPLSTMARTMLVHSDNVTAETIGWSAIRSAPGGYREGTGLGDHLLRHLRRLMPEVDWCGARLGNGSGLDQGGRLTPRQLVAIVRYGWLHHGLAALLPAGGWSGTLSERFSPANEVLRVWAKTGTMNYGNSLAGYLFGRSGRPAAFAIMTSDIGARERAGGRASEAARSWNARARALQDKLIGSWLEPLPGS